MVKVIGRGLEGIREFIRKCIEAGGTPIFRTKYGLRKFRDRVVAACWGAGEKVEGGTIVDVPPDIIAEMEEKVGDWKWLAERLGMRIPT